MYHLLCPTQLCLLVACLLAPLMLPYAAAYGLVEHAEWLLAQQYFEASEEMLRKWSCYMGRVAEESWPLLTKSVLYTIVYTRWNEQFLARCIIAETLELDLEQETKNEE